MLFFAILIYIGIGIYFVETTPYDEPLDNPTYLGEVLTWFPDLIIHLFNK